MSKKVRDVLIRIVAPALVVAAAVVINVLPASAADFTPGNLVVVRVGDGSSALSGAAASVFLDEYTPSGGLVRSVALPTAVSGSNRRLTMSGSATSEGALSLSSDGTYLSLAGYDADPGTAAIASTTTTAVARVVARVDVAGTIDTSTTVTDAFSGSNVRGAVTDNGSRFWVVGGNGGTRLATFGNAGTTTQINSAAPTNLRVVGIAGGQLYVTTGSAPTGLYAVGSGLPTSGGQTAALTSAVPSPYGFVALDRDPSVSGVDTLYVADDSGSPNGGVLKFSFDGTTWTARGSVRPANSGARGITGSITGSSVTLFATTSAGTNQLVRVEDSAAFDAPIAATTTVLQTAAASTALRGVAFVPGGGTPSAPVITTQPQSSTIASGATATLTVAASGAGPITYQWYQGATGDTSTPVAGATAASFTTAALTQTTSYWVRVTNSTGSTDSATATVTVSAGACSTPVVTIGSVQGTTDVSPKAGQTVSVRGTVVADFEGPSPQLRGFYLQDAGDGDAATSDGVFVFNGNANLVSNGDVVQVTGAVSEFQGQTQISPPSGGVELCGSTATVSPVDITLPRASTTDLEPYEGMLVRFHQTLTVTEHFQLGRFGQVVVSSGGRLRQPTSDIRATNTAAVAAAQHANDLNHIIIDDADQTQNPDPIVFGRGGNPLSASNTLRGGDTVTDAVGVMTYTWAGNSASGNAYRLRPVGALGGSAVFNPANPRPTAPPSVGAAGVKVASANLLNFFNTYTNCHLGTLGDVTDCRGATSDTEYNRQLAKEVASLRFLGADVIGYMEMENDGYGPTSAVQALVNALNAADGPGTWAFINPDAATGVTDVAGTDAIKAGVIYKTASVQPVAGATFVDQNALFERRPVAQTFATPGGARFTVIANHFKSKGSCPTSGPDTDQGDGQSCWNAHRTDQANELAAWISATVIPGAGDPDVLIVGDLNSYAGEDPIAALEAAGYTNLAKAYHGDDAYSYVFDGQWGYLDFGLASASLVPQVTGADDVHHNSDEPSVLDYNTDFKSAGQIASLYAPDRFRTSDHDPVLIGLDLGRAATISGTPTGATLGVPYSFEYTVGDPSNTVVSLDSGTLPPGVTLDPHGTIAGTPTAAGDFAFTLRAHNAFGDATVSSTVHVAKGASATTVSASPNPVATGAGVTFTATVTGAVVPTGTVTFREGSTTLGTGSVGADGKATLNTSSLSAGEHIVVANYAGDGNLLQSTSDTLAVAVVDPGNLGSTLPGGSVGTPYSANIPYTGGTPVTFSVTTGSLPPGLDLSAAGVVAGTPTDSGSYVFTVAAQNPVGTTTQSYTVTIDKAATTTVVTSSANPSIVGGGVKFTAQVTGTAGLTPTGSVQFTVDGQALGGPVPLGAGGQATSPVTSQLTAGSHTVKATYSGDGSLLGSSDTVTQIVRYAVTIVSPDAGARLKAGSTVQIDFRVADANGDPLPLLQAWALSLRPLTVTVSGAQSFGPVPATYDPVAKVFEVKWKSDKKPTGTVTITVSIPYPDAPTQVVTTTLTLT